jgi:glycerophosphoryl diester phosphodiesterase
MRTLVIAHRTCPLQVCENSIAGIRLAADLGADGVEIDVQRTLDGVPVLMHDRTLWRSAGLCWPARLLPFALLRRRRLRGLPQAIPTLREALEALPAGLIVAIDIKHASAAPVTLAEVRRQRLESRTLLWSKQISAIRYTAREAPEIESSLLRDALTPRSLQRFLDDAQRSGARGISAHWDVITEGFLRQAHARGVRVYSMSLSADSQPEKLALPLDGIVTDWPAEARNVLESLRGHKSMPSRER